MTNWKIAIAFASCLMLGGRVWALSNVDVRDFGIVGDGVHDDTSAIQVLLDSGSPCVALPIPKKEYLISKTLHLHSGQELRLARFARVRLAP